MDQDAGVDIVARTLDGEAGGEGKRGMTAVACVILKRAIIATKYVKRYDRPHPLFGDGSLSSVCLAEYKGIHQFSCWNAGDPNRERILNLNFSDPTFLVAVDIAWQAERDELEDITNGATHYQRIGTGAKWAAGKTPCFVLGRHEFFNDIAYG